VTGGVSAGTFLEFIAEVLENGAITSQVFRITGCAVADYAGPFLRPKSTFPSTEMIIERFTHEYFVGITCVGASGVCRWGALGNIPITTDGTLPWILVIVGALFHNGL